ncbi:MAG: hypothetical protein E7H54_05490 [Clostridium perfringens]|uniref:hypothetical protein n=1 Tax=Clostridium perfringens TaxID=1502 RepID=UPI0024BD5B8C|nr:hypothetical protein [Clostridium perfringens]MDU8988617.1 hypothetical protein [Clostridium perfringens]
MKTTLQNLKRIFGIILVSLNIIGFIDFIIEKNVYTVYPVLTTIIITIWFIFEMRELDSTIKLHTKLELVIDTILYIVWLGLPLITAYVASEVYDEISMYLVLSLPLFYSLTFDDVCQSIAKLRLLKPKK